MRELAVFFGCDPCYAAVCEARKSYSPSSLFEKVLSESNIKAVLIDDGFLPEKSRGIKWHSKYVEARRILRIEKLAQDALLISPSFDTFESIFSSRLKNESLSAAALKTVAAYRCGLEIKNYPLKAVRESFLSVKRSGGRIVEAPLISFLLRLAAKNAIENDIPLQIHTGFGDSDLSLFRSDPALLKNFIEDGKNRGLKIVLLHAGYPYVKSAGWMASIYGDVYVDIGLAVMYLSVRGIISMLHELMELCPLNKIIYSSDAHFAAELYYLGAKSARQALCEVFLECCIRGELSAEEALYEARGILYENGMKLYRM